MSAVTLRLAVDEPLDAASMLASFALHALPGAEEVDVVAGTYRRLLPVASGPVAATLTFSAGHIDVVVQGDSATAAETTTGEGAAVARLVRRWLDLDADLAAVRATLGSDPTIGPLLAARPGLRIVGHPDGFEAAVMTVLGQQVSLAACRTFGGRAVAAWGNAGPAGLVSFPTAARLAALTPDEIQQGIRITGARARTVQALAETVAAGLVIHPDGDHADIRHRLLAVPGIGPWTADYLTVRVLGDRDGFAAGDLVLRRALGGVTTADATARAAAWAPFRAYALFHLWSSAAAGI